MVRSSGRGQAPWNSRRASSAPAREVLWNQDAANALRWGSRHENVRLTDGAISRVVDPPPLRLNADGREEAFGAEGVRGTGVLCTDGTYVYVSRFYSPTAVYPGTDVFERMGTGLGGTRAGQNHGALSETPVPGVSATYHGDGFIYADDGRGRDLVRIAPATGVVDRVRVPDGLMEFRTGFVSRRALADHVGRYVHLQSWRRRWMACSARVGPFVCSIRRTDGAWYASLPWRRRRPVSPISLPMA